MICKYTARVYCLIMTFVLPSQTFKKQLFNLFSPFWSFVLITDTVIPPNRYQYYWFVLHSRMFGHFTCLYHTLRHNLREKRNWTKKTKSILISFRSNELDLVMCMCNTSTFCLKSHIRLLCLIFFISHCWNIASKDTHTYSFESYVLLSLRSTQI